MKDCEAHDNLPERCGCHAPKGGCRGGLLVVSGPSGSGKTTICRRLAEHSRVALAISATTRPRRANEVEGRDYYFLNRCEFERRIREGEFVEYNEVFGNDVLYGSLRSEVEKGLADPDRYYLMEIDVQGGLNLKAMGYEGTYLFVKPPSMEELRRRLVTRATENDESVKKRLAKAEWELGQADRYDLTVVNDDLETAVSEIEGHLGLVN